MKTECQVGSIREIQERLVREGYKISQYTLRIWVKQGKLPVVYTGTKALLSYDKVILLLTGSTPTSTAS